ncbi:non-specific serine/threonine protein kinase [Trifolium repens]|nr:non-specific serine/threonine protein kinase [Trifolium repens]
MHMLLKDQILSHIQGTKLPEVYCNTYRQVDPPAHSSMRHLFGTWRGVFPPQTLQIIEKELGFSPAVNGIHVNLKYAALRKRQRLQQSNMGVFNDMTGVISNSNEDLERPDRALGAARLWLDPRINMHNNQRPQINAFNDYVPDKSIGARCLRRQ